MDSQRWAVERRLDYIDWHLTVHGVAPTRQAIAAVFGVSLGQAAVDIAIFRRRYPGALSYDPRRKRYLPHGRVWRSRRGWTPAAIRAMRALGRANQAWSFGEHDTTP